MDIRLYTLTPLFRCEDLNLEVCPSFFKHTLYTLIVYTHPVYLDGLYTPCIP